MEGIHLYELMQKLGEIFDIVRLVDTDEMKVCSIDEKGVIKHENYRCYSVWNKHERCVNCISAKACLMDSRLEKFEFIDGEIYHVISKNVTISDKKYALELVTKADDETLFEAYGKGEFVRAICKINEKMYVDVLTGLKNRRYYDEQRGLLDKSEAMAMIDIDNFKQINDTYGHLVGDTVLSEVGHIILSSVRESDVVVRYGGDEIYIFFPNMQEKYLEKRLNTIRCNVKEIVIPDYPDIHVTLSIGGYYRGNAKCNPIDIADKKMYQAKQKKDCVVV